MANNAHNQCVCVCEWECVSGSVCVCVFFFGSIVYLMRILNSTQCQVKSIKVDLSSEFSEFFDKESFLI